MPLYAACDLHSNNTVLAVLDEAGAVQLRQRIPNDLGLIDAALMPFRGNCRESRSNLRTTHIGCSTGCPRPATPPRWSTRWLCRSMPASSRPMITPMPGTWPT